MKRNIWGIALLMGTVTTGIAQPQPKPQPEAPMGLSGSIAIQGGVGAANPWDAQIRLSYKTEKVQIMPFLGITGVTEKSSEIDDDTRLIYARPGFSYASSSTLQSKGTLMNYGSDFKFDFDKAGQLMAGAKVYKEDLERTGYGHQLLTNANAGKPTDLLYTLNAPKQNRTNLDAFAAYDYKFNDQTLTFRYDFSKQEIDLDEENSYRDNGSELERILIRNISESEIIVHKLKAQYRFDRSRYYRFAVGATYLDRDIESHNSQPMSLAFDNPANHILMGENKMEDFTHQMHTLSAYTDWVFYWFNPNTPVWTLVLNLAYDDTQMAGCHFSDFVPVVHLNMPITGSHLLRASYVRRIIRPELELLNPFERTDFFTISHGDPTLEGIHANVVNLAHQFKHSDKVEVSTVASHIFTKDGFNAIWKFDEKGRREYTWGNAGERTAWSVAPEVKYRPIQILSLHAKTTLLWDKRIAEAISMEKEHWGITAEASAKAQFTQKLSLDLHGLYSEGNTIDLYSHESRNFKAGAAVEFALAPRMTLHLSCDYRDYGRTVITQGAYTGSIDRAPSNRLEGLARLVIRL